MYKMKYQTLISLMIGLFVITACHGSPQKEENKHMVGMRNPASVYCAQLHGESIPVNTPQGQYANCKLPSGEIIEEWALFRRDHPQPKQ